MKRHSPAYDPSIKPFYSPLEAAIRWSDLYPFEKQIVQKAGFRAHPQPEEYPEWPALFLNLERIYDALHNGDLACGKHGYTLWNRVLINEADLTIRHVDLKIWMGHFYPTHKPPFLFTALERKMIEGINTDSLMHALTENKALALRYESCRRDYALLRKQHQDLTNIHSNLIQKLSVESPSVRSDTTYLNIIGAMLTLMLGSSPAGTPYSAFKTQEAIIDALLAHYGHRLGISTRTLQGKFAAAKRSIKEE